MPKNRDKMEIRVERRYLFGMKAVIIIMLALLVSCKTGSNEKLLKKLGMEEIAQKRFDIETFEKNKKKRYKYITSDTDQIYEFTDSTGIHHEQRWSEGLYYDIITYPDSLFCDIFIFYSSGTIKNFCKALVTCGIGVGSDVYFDEAGNVESIINFDEHHPFTLDQVLAFMKENDIDVWDENVKIYRLKASSGLSEGDPIPPKPYWWSIDIHIPWQDYEDEIKERIRERKPIPYTRKRVIDLDAVTGEVLSDKIEDTYSDS